MWGIPAGVSAEYLQDGFRYPCHLKPTFSKFPTTSVCISSTRPYLESGLYCCDTATARNMRHVFNVQYEKSFQPFSKRDEGTKFKHLIARAFLSVLWLHFGKYRLLMQIRNNAFLGATAFSLALSALHILQSLTLQGESGFVSVSWWSSGDVLNAKIAWKWTVFLAEFRHHNSRENPADFFQPGEWEEGAGKQNWCERETRCLKHTVHPLYHVVMLFGPAMASCCYSQRSGSRAATHSQCHLKDFIIPGHKYQFIWNKWPRREREGQQIAGQHKEHCVDTQTCLSRAGGFHWVNMDRSGQEWAGRGTYPMNIYPFAGSICVRVWGHSTAAQHTKAESKAFTG